MPATPRSSAPERWLMKRRCALRPGQLGGALAVAAAIDGGAGLVFLAAGYAPLGGFCLLTVLALAAAFVAHARHATDHESIELGDRDLRIEQHRGPRRHCVRLPAAGTRVGQSPAPEHLVVLSAGAVSVLVGEHLPCHQRPALAHELRQALHRRRWPA